MIKADRLGSLKSADELFTRGYVYVQGIFLSTKGPTYLGCDVTQDLMIYTAKTSLT